MRTRKSPKGPARTRKNLKGFERIRKKIERTQKDSKESERTQKGSKGPDCIRTEQTDGAIRASRLAYMVAFYRLPIWQHLHWPEDLASWFQKLMFLVPYGRTFTVCLQGAARVTLVDYCFEVRRNNDNTFVVFSSSFVCRQPIDSRQFVTTNTKVNLVR